ncbi:hypothetical protein BGZ97_001043 [Linnemannia gamsii]|uniref:Uncharacterized protein n=1 Tax=Linnemannia gamsii TaxID=64522 RepID=A0A9P6UJS9_9FUNG|nr:hypothetical protein BGZ97_001043 [Linnemannia gamsii]
MAQSDSLIDQPAPYSITDIGSSNKRQSSSVLASISSTFLGIGSSLRSRNHSNTSSVSLATIRSSAAVNDSVAIKSHNQTAQITCVLPPSTSITSVSNASANVPNVRSFSNIFNTGRQHPMSTPSHSLSTPTLPSFNQANQANEPFVVRRTGCTCHNKQFPGPCLFHKKLPSIPVAQLEDQDATGSIKEKKSSRVSAMFTTVSIRSFIASMKKSRLQSTSVQSLVEINTPSSKEPQFRSQSNTSLPSIHPQEPTLNHAILLSHTSHKNRTGPSSTVYRAKKRHTAADVPLTGSPESSMDQLGLQQVKRQAIYGLKERSLDPSYHGSEQSHPCADRLYLCPMSDSTPGSAPLCPFTKATTSDKDLIRRVPAITRIRQAAESAPNLSLHGGTQVSAVNVQAELIGHPHIAEASTTSRRGGLNFIANSTPDLPSTAHSRSLMVPAPSAYSTEPYNKENATFFEPFQAYSHIHGGQASRYVSFHFDLSHLEKAENDAEGDLTLATKADMDHPEQVTVVEGEDGEEEPSNRFAPTVISTLATVSNPSVHLPSQPRSDQQTAVKRFFGRTGHYKLVNGVTPGYAIELLVTLGVNYITTSSLESDAFEHGAAIDRSTIEAIGEQVELDVVEERKKVL